jgi:divalent metal cation (Fe/Co/Zn/Cd) transporter
VDVALPDEDLKLVEEILSKFMKGEISYHKVRSRKSGPYKYLDFHLNVPGDMSVKESHSLCDKIEMELKSKINTLDINIHVEPAKVVD